MNPRLLVVEDDPTLRSALHDALTREGYDVTTARDGREGSDLLFGRHFDAVLLDLMLPKRGGLEILREVRENGLRVPILLLTVRGDENDKVLGFELGADDYVTKPFSLRELLARVKALVRRGRNTGFVSRDTDPPVRFDIGRSAIDLGAFELTRDGVVHRLSAKEAAILSLLHRNSNRVVSRDRFLDEIWGEEPLVSHRTIDTHVLNLRQKLEDDPKSPTHLVTVHGVGYRLVFEA